MSKDIPEMWAGEGDEFCTKEVDDVVTDIIDGGEVKTGDVITVVGYDIDVINDNDKKIAAANALEVIYEGLDEEYEYPDCGDNNEPSEEIKAKMAELIELICKDYYVTNCHKVVKKKVRITDADNWKWEWVEVVE